ncbi:multidrug efflux transporter AcrB transmembrane domain-containing protein [Testicularia cyperi]|uniref:Multidrug efflux transporter AcrB transmembrane domain-containing protein n=1 Tax=Testicularia cyperi TaxID=1882483 RepID=A0A317XRG1_9BASI|nr:multidrug efflux transporter AcrB transmembrane domain-containing protein [Testicularia cyperi]
MSQTQLSTLAPKRPPGRCHMQGSCGKKSVFSPELPCPVDEKAAFPNQDFRRLLVDTCGSDYNEGPVCCTQDQVESLSANLQQAEALISSCPACRNNFRALFCSFTCSPNQSQFLDVSQTQTVTGSDGKENEAVKTVEFFIEESWKQAFFDSCKDVKFGASNGFAMDLIGGGAKNPAAFLKFLGDEKPLLGSPFQINFPATADAGWGQHRDDRNNGSLAPPSPFNRNPRHCGDPDLLSRCACVDCPATCAALPDAPSFRGSGDGCAIGPFSCYVFFAVSVYLLLALGVLFWGTFARLKGKRTGRIHLPHRGSGLSFFSEGSGFERVRLDSDDSLDTDQAGTDARTGASFRGTPARASGERSLLVGARGLGHFGEEASSGSSGPASFFRGLGIGREDALSALSAPQPRKYPLNRVLSRFFYRLGLFCASRPWLTLSTAALLVGLANLGWRDFAVETDPVGLWVAPGSTAKAQKDFFDQEFGPFYRPQQIFVMDRAAYHQLSEMRQHPLELPVDAVPPALSWERLLWLADLEKEIRSLHVGGSGTTLQDVCLAPAGPGTACVVQSILGYFQDDPEGYGLSADDWDQYLDQCAQNPAECLPAFGQPLKPNIVLGGIPHRSTTDLRASKARSAVVTYVLNNSLNSTKVRQAEEWEQALLTLLLQVAGKQNIDTSRQHPLSQRREELGLEIAFSTGVSLEGEIGSSSNTDVGIVVLSYITMFLYAALTLGGKRNATPAAQPDSRRATGDTSADGYTTTYPRWPSSARSATNEAPRRSLASRLWSHCQRFLRGFCVDSKFTLGLFGIFIVLAAVSTAVGIFSALGVKVTLIIAEVIPFMLLAVGVDNIFLLCNEMDKQGTTRVQNGAFVNDSLSRPSATESSPTMNSARTAPLSPDLPFDEEDAVGSDGVSSSPSQISRISSAERAARALANMGPSILLSATTQIVAFLLGALVPMPAVRNFALYAAGSMFIVAMLHCTVFVAAMAMDADRTEGGRIDCLPCIRTARIRLPTTGDITSAAATNGGSDAPRDSALDSTIKFSYAPRLLRPTAKKLVALLFGALLVVSSIGVGKLEMGLDQRLALPSLSYLRPYFDAIDVFLDVGPPVYFVASGRDVSFRPGQRGLCGRFTTCEPLSLANTLEGERKRSEVSLLAEPASSWIDDFLQWLNPVLEGCCRVRKRDPTAFCGPNESEFDCQPCFLDREPAWNITMDGLPEADEFYQYLEQWLKSPTDQDCPLGGLAAYSSALNISSDPNTGQKKIVASHFRTYFSPLRTQSDFIEALQQSQRISEDVSRRVGYDVFPYSLFFIFFEQYTYLRSMAVQVLGSAALAIFAITTVLLGSWRTGAVVTLCVASAVFGVAGTMGFWGIQFNALTLVNLSVCSAIGVEFCAHIARAFMKAPGSLPRSHPMSQKERDERAWAALSDVGSSVVSGIFSTKLIGVGVLYFTRSELLKLYYAKMWLSLILGGFLHGLILLPVLLSWLGGRGWSDGQDENDVKRRLDRAGSEYRPMMASEAEGSDAEEEL